MVITTEYNIYGEWQLTLEGLIFSLAFSLLGVAALIVSFVVGIKNMIEAKQTDVVIWRRGDKD